MRIKLITQKFRAKTVADNHKKSNQKMSHKYQKDFSLPANFQDTLRDFTREVLRTQPSNIYRFGFEYFMNLSKEMEKEAGTEKPEVKPKTPVVTELNTVRETETVVETKKDEKDQNEEIYGTESEGEEEDVHEYNETEEGEEGDIIDAINSMPAEELHALIGNHLASFGEEVLPLDGLREEFKKIFQYQLPEIVLLFVLCEAEISQDLKVDINIFSQKSTNILKTICTVDAFLGDLAVDESALVQGLNKAELEEELKTIFERADENQSGTIPYALFRKELEEAELDLSLRQVNILLSQVEIDENGNILYEDCLANAHKFLFAANFFDEFCVENELQF